MLWSGGGGQSRHFKLNLLAFVIAFAVGILYVYLFTPPPEIVIKFPTPYNSGKVIYTDATVPETCFVYDAKKTECTKEARPQPSPETNTTKV